MYVCMYVCMYLCMCPLIITIIVIFLITILITVITIKESRFGNLYFQNWFEVVCVGEGFNGAP